MQSFAIPSAGTTVRKGMFRGTNRCGSSEAVYPKKKQQSCETGETLALRAMPDPRTLGSGRGIAGVAAVERLLFEPNGSQEQLHRRERDANLS